MELSGKRFLLGSGPKPIVDKVEEYFKVGSSIAVTLLDLLNHFDYRSFQTYVPIDDDLVEIKKCVIVGKKDDGEVKIKQAFTRLSNELKKNDISKRFGQSEAPICLLSYVLERIVPDKPTYCKYYLGLQKKKSSRQLIANHSTHELLDITDNALSNRTIGHGMRRGLIEKIKHDIKDDPTMIPTRNHFHKNEIKKPLRTISYNYSSSGSSHSNKSSDGDGVKRQKRGRDQDCRASGTGNPARDQIREEKRKKKNRKNGNLSSR